MVSHLCALALLGAAAAASACSGAQEQDVLSTDVGSSATSGGTSGQTSGNTSGQTSGNTSGQTSGDPGTSGGTTSGDPVPGDCVREKDDSSERNKLPLTTCAAGQFRIGRDQEDWLVFTRAPGTKIRFKWTGPVAVSFWDDNGNEYGVGEVPNAPGEYSIQLQYNFREFPLNQEQIDDQPRFDWTFTMTNE